jgi:hypothetical protein
MVSFQRPGGGPHASTTLLLGVEELNWLLENPDTVVHRYFQTGVEGKI